MTLATNSGPVYIRKLKKSCKSSKGIIRDLLCTELWLPHSLVMAAAASPAAAASTTAPTSAASARRPSPVSVSAPSTSAAAGGRCDDATGREAARGVSDATDAAER